MNKFAALLHAYYGNHSPEYNDQLSTWSALARLRRSSFAFPHTRACSTVCMGLAMVQRSLQDSLLALAGIFAGSAASRCLLLRAGWRIVEHRWQDDCPKSAVPLTTRRELVLVSEAMQSDIADINLSGALRGRRTDLSSSIAQAAMLWAAQLARIRYRVVWKVLRFLRAIDDLRKDATTACTL